MGSQSLRSVSLEETELCVSLLSARAPRSLRKQHTPHSQRLPSLCVFSLCSLGLSKISVHGICPNYFIFFTVCQPDNSRHVIQGLVKCFTQQSLCYINYSYSTAQNKLHFDYTVIFQSIHLPDRDHGRSEGHTCEWKMNAGSSPLCVPRSPF